MGGTWYTGYPSILVCFQTVVHNAVHLQNGSHEKKGRTHGSAPTKVKTRYELNEKDPSPPTFVSARHAVHLQNGEKKGRPPRLHHFRHSKIVYFSASASSPMITEYESANLSFT